MKNNKKTIKIVILNSIQDLQRLSLSLNNIRGRSRIKYGMTALFKNGGFTLIELLVVVLIIGILAAVAVPQYQKSVKKSQYTEMLSIITPIAKAAKVYYLQTGAHPTSRADLDIDIPGLNSNGCLKNGICIFLEKATDRIYAAKGAQCENYAYYGGRICNGYIYQMKPYGLGSIIAQPGIYCFQSVNWNATVRPDGMCQGEVVKSDANGTLHKVI